MKKLQMKKKQRQSNIELLRIIAMLMIIDVHYFAASNAGAILSPGMGTYYVFHALESMGICGVNLFVLITGYFSTNQNSIKIRKIADLLVDIAFWGFVGFVLCVIVGWKALDLKDMIKTMLPILFGGRWFVRAYIVLLCLIPFINRVVRSISQKSYQKLLIICVILFSIWPSFLPNPPLDDYGYGFVQFVFLYLIGGYIRLYVKLYPPRWLCLAGYFIGVAIVCISSLAGIGYAWAYNYVFVMAEAVALFLFFAQVKMQSGVINRLAACAFGVFLIHTDGFFSRLIYEHLFHASELMNGSPWLFLASAAVCIPTFYVVGFVLESVKQKVFLHTVDWMMDRIPVLNRVISIEGE